MRNNLLKKILIVTSIVVSFRVNAQTPNIQWQKSLGGTGTDYCYDVQKTTDGGYIIAGNSNSNNGDVSGNHGNYDYWVVKIDSLGVIQWQKSLGGSGEDQANSIKQTTDGGYIIAGYTKSTNGDVTGNHGNKDYWVVKLDNTGTIQWQKCYGGTLDDEANHIQQTTDGGYIIAGYTKSTNGDVTGHILNEDYWVVKTDNLGTIQWQKCYGGNSTEKAYSIVQTSDGGYIVAGYSSSSNGDVTANHSLNEYWILKVNNTGTIQWQNTYGGNASDVAKSIIQTSDGGYIVAGNSASTDGDITSNHGGSDYWILKLDNLGAIQWQKTLGGTGADNAASVEQTNDGGYVVSGYSQSNNGDVTGNHSSFNDYWVVKLNNSGAIQWQKTLGGTLADGATSIHQTTDGGFIVAGSSPSTDGDVTGNHGSWDYWVVKLDNNVSTSINETSLESIISIYPNPANEVITIGNLPSNSIVSILDITGKVIYNTISKTENFIINTLDFVNGIYILQVNSNRVIATKKLMINK